MKQKGEWPHRIERVTKDRLGFLNVAVHRVMQESELQSSGLPQAPFQTILGVPWTRTDIDGEDGRLTVRWLYEGLAENYTTGALKEIYEFDPSYEEVPIRAHPDFKKWIDAGYGTQDAFGNVYWYPDLSLVTDPAATGLSGGGSTGSGKRNPMLGVEAYAVMGGIWRKQYAALRLPGNLFGRVGTIVTRPPGPVPNVPKGRNFLKAPPRVRFRGNAWDISEEWILSGVGGHNGLVYNGEQEADGGA